MGFTVWLAIIYLLLIISTTVAWTNKKKILAIVLISLMALGIILLGYLWITFPM